ncbi:MAG: septum formation inhibitor Maf [Campylobacterota bacterium]
MLHLCSSSPTRAKLLQSFAIAYKQVSCEFDEESIKVQDPKSFVYSAAKGKFACCKRKFDTQIPILAADTVVTCGGQLLRKPKNIDDAAKMLQLQSGASVKIITALFYESKTISITDIAATRYCLAPFDKTDLDRYLQSGMWQGKAGGIMVEGFCKKYIKSVTGLQSTAMGLQVEHLLPFIKDVDNV